MLYTLIDQPSNEPVQFVGCYTTRWGHAVEPTVSFREATDEELKKAYKERFGQNEPAVESYSDQLKRMEQDEDER
jgi:hypothetical protein